MGYDRTGGYGRDGYGYGSMYGPGRRPERDGRGDYGRYEDGGRGYRARYDRDYARDAYARDVDPNDRGFFDRAGDEVRSWFGDDEAEARRRADEARDERYDREQGYDRGRGWSDARGARGGRVSQSDYDAAYAASYGAFGGAPSYGSNQRVGQDRGQQQRGRHDHDPHYRDWRDRQMDALDRDYEEYRTENQTRFNSEFGSWRQTRQTQRDALSRVQEHQEVVGSDGQHVGTVDHVRGDRIQLTKTDKDAHGHHHTIPSSWIKTVGDKVELSKTADQAQHAWREEHERAQQHGGLFGGGDDDRGPTNLNRSFSGTY